MEITTIVATIPRRHLGSGDPVRGGCRGVRVIIGVRCVRSVAGIGVWWRVCAGKYERR